MYHSRYGAIQESVHVFLQAGLHYLLNGDSELRSIKILEVGFGTGLNAFLTAIESQKLQIHVTYTTLEPFPLTAVEAALLNYPGLLGHPGLFSSIHDSIWNEPVPINEYFTLEKYITSLQLFTSPITYQLVFFDAFAPLAQPEMWTEEMFRKVYGLMGKGGVLVTYCSKGDVKRAMKAAGFTIEKLPGPIGKREMIRAMV
jgi:tRNA U34 5-methylaminomethyl-2-thiouridine-forming methyltransferase MnmC